jgi:glycosyltransferase involved in cell wall biosynthesis
MMIERNAQLNGDCKVSVIIPAYNSAGTLAHAIRSVLNQTYTAFEIIVVDDGSTDGTAAVARAHDVELISQANSGPSAARNHGIRVAKGELIAFLDADDAWLPQKLALQVAQFASNEKLGFCATALFICDSDLKVDYVLSSCPESHRGIMNALMVKNIFTTTSIMAKKACFDAVGTFDESIKFGEDWDMWFRIANAFPVAYLREPLCFYRQLSTGITNFRGIDNIHEWKLIVRRNRERSRGFYTRTAGYLQAMSFFYGNHSYFHKVQGDIALEGWYILASILLWPFSDSHRYRVVLYHVPRNFLKKALSGLPRR